MEKEKRKLSLGEKMARAAYGCYLPFKTEISIRIQSLISLAAILTSWYLQLSREDWLWIIAAIAFVLMAEILNTAIEKLVDLVSPGYNELAGKVKDIAAGAVFLAALVSAVIGLLIFIPYF